MITFLKTRKKVMPELNEIFGVVNQNSQVINIKCVETEDPDSCHGCAFENLCENHDSNQTQFMCNEEDRLDDKNVIFKIIG